jgi:hypothetical protein
MVEITADNSLGARALREMVITKRALAAYWGSDADPRFWPDPHYCRVQEVDGLVYVVLARADAALAVYRWLPRGQLKRLRRWPEEITRWKPRRQAAAAPLRRKR